MNRKNGFRPATAIMIGAKICKGASDLNKTCMQYSPHGGYNGCECRCVRVDQSIKNDI